MKNLDEESIFSLAKCDKMEELMDLCVLRPGRPPE